MKNELSIVLLFSRGIPFVHECSANCRTRFAHFDGFSSKLPEIAKFSLKIVILCHFEYFSTFLVRNSVRGATFNFSADFHEYILNMTYHVTEAIDGYF